MFNRRILVLAGLAAGIGLAVAGAAREAGATDRCFPCRTPRCFPCTTTIHGCYGYRVSSRCVNGQPYYQTYDVGVPNVVDEYGPPYSAASSIDRRREGYFAGWRDLLR